MTAGALCIVACLGSFLTLFGAKLPFLVLFGEFLGEHSGGFSSKERGGYFSFPQLLRQKKSATKPSIPVVMWLKDFPFKCLFLDPGDNGFKCQAVLGLFSN